MTESDMATDAEDYFAIIPEWVLYAPISAQAVRLYCVLRRKADNTTNESYYSRRSLARLLGAKDPKVTDRALEDLERIEAVRVTRGRVTGEGDPAPNLYRVMSSRPLGVVAQTPQGSDLDASRVVAQRGDELRAIELRATDKTSATTYVASETVAVAGVTARDVVAAYGDRYSYCHAESPPARSLGRIAREARQLLEDGKDADRLIASAIKCADEGHANLSSAYTWIIARDTRLSGRQTKESATSMYMSIADSQPVPELGS